MCHGLWRSAAATWRCIGHGGLTGMARLRQQIGMLAQPVAGALDLHDDGVVQQSVEQCSGHDRIAKNFAPLGKAAVGGENHGALLVAGVDQLEEQIAGAGTDAQIADLIDDEQLGATEITDAFAQPSLAVGAGETVDDVGKRGEVDAAAGTDGFDTESHGKVALAGTGLADEVDHLVAID
jgi:hypothetical protein